MCNKQLLEKTIYTNSIADVYKFGNSGSYIRLLDENNQEDNVLLSLSTDKRKDIIIDTESKERIDLYMNKSTAYFIFGTAILNCMTNNIDSKFSFNNIYSIHDKKVLSIITKMNTYPGAEEKDIIVINVTINISLLRKKPKVKIVVKYKVGFVNRMTDRFDYIKPEYNDLPKNLELDFKDCFDLISLVTIPNYN